MHTMHLSVRRSFLFLPPLLLCNPPSRTTTADRLPLGVESVLRQPSSIRQCTQRDYSALLLSFLCVWLLFWNWKPVHITATYSSSAASTVSWHSLSLGSGGFWSYHEDCFQWWQILFLLESQVKHAWFWGKKKNLLMVTKWTKKAGKMLDTMAHSTFWVRSCWDSLCVCSN